MEIISRAIIFAAKAHDGMRRKQTATPYILHPVEAAAIAGSLTDDQEVMAAAVLHDVVEDTSITIEEIEAEFGKRVADLVASESEDKREGEPPSETWQIRKEEAVQFLRNTDNKDIKILYLGDKLANMRSIYKDWAEAGDSVWERFNQKEKSHHAWYYRSVAEAMPELKETPAWKEYDKLIKIVFEEGENK